MPGFAIWAWRGSAADMDIVRDLASARITLGKGLRASLHWFPEACVKAAPFAGEVGASMQDADVSGAIGEAAALAPDALAVGADVKWAAEADKAATEAGWIVSKS